MTTKRKGAKDVITLAFQLLSDGEFKSLNQIATEIGSNTKTIRKYMDLVEYIQKQDPITILETKVATLVKLGPINTENEDNTSFQDVP